MSTNKTYYYLKLKENFFDSEEIKILESSENGYLYSNILLKIYLKSIKNEGRLMLRENIPYNSKMIATITSHNIDIVEKAIKIFEELGLIQILDSGAIYISDIQSFVGKISSEGVRKKLYRNQIVKEKLGHSWDNVPKSLVKRPPEIEIEKEKEIEKKIDIEIKNFDRFYEIYPIHKSKESARKIFDKINPDEELINKMIEAIELQKQEKQIKAKSGKFCPEWKHPSTWLNQRCWKTK